MINDVMRKEKILDNLQFISYIHFITIQLQTRGNINHYQQKISDVIKKEITKITNFLREVQDYPYSKKDYSTKAYEKETKNIIKKVAENKGIINFKKILELLTSIDEKYIQCGLKGVLMKVDVTNRNFEGISMKNTSLIGWIEVKQIQIEPYSQIASGENQYNYMAYSTTINFTQANTNFHYQFYQED